MDIAVVAVAIFGIIAMCVSATSAYVLYRWVRPIAKKSIPVINSAARFLENDTGAQIKQLMTNDVPHMVSELMSEQVDTMFINYAPKIQKAVMVGVEQVARPLVQETMDALGEGISQAIGQVVTEILRHDGAQQFGKEGGIQKVKNAQVREGKKHLIQNMVAAKAGPMAAGVVSNLGLDDEFLDLQESNPELAGMIIKKLTGEEGQSDTPPDAHPRHKSPGGWYS